MFDIAFKNISLIVILFLYISYNANLKTKTYLCMKANKIVYLSKEIPKTPYKGKCFYTSEITNAKYAKYKKLLTKQP